MLRYLIFSHHLIHSENKIFDENIKQKIFFINKFETIEKNDKLKGQ